MARLLARGLSVSFFRSAEESNDSTTHLA